MSVVTIRSEEARSQWRETIDKVYVNKEDVVIERYGKPIVTVINYARWQDMVKRLQEVEFGRRTRQKYEQMKVDPSRIVTEEQYEAMLQAEGLVV